MDCKTHTAVALASIGLALGSVLQALRPIGVNFPVSFQNSNGVQKLQSPVLALSRTLSHLLVTEPTLQISFSYYFSPKPTQQLPLLPSDLQLAPFFRQLAPSESTTSSSTSGAAVRALRTPLLWHFPLF